MQTKRIFSISMAILSTLSYNAFAERVNVDASKWGHHQREKVTIAVNTPAYARHHHRNVGPTWINLRAGQPLPADAVIGGGENGYLLYVCRANYQGIQHAGKLLPNGQCHISANGQEILKNKYQILTSHRRLHWVAGTRGFIPSQAIVGANNAGNIAYVCQANFRGGQHPGEILRKKCKIAYGGQVIKSPIYNVLTI